MNNKSILKVLFFSFSLLVTSLSQAGSISLYQHLHRLSPGLSAEALKYALHAYEIASAKHLVRNPMLTVIDYSLPSSRQRMWVFDLRKERLFINTFVAHGQNSGMNTASHFSNRPSSKTSSLGTFITKDTYAGHNGLSLNLQGLEHGFNDNALSRRVVIHGAWYMEPSVIRSMGRAGRSWGCPAVARSIAPKLINTIKGGSVVFAYYPDSHYLHSSHYA